MKKVVLLSVSVVVLCATGVLAIPKWNVDFNGMTTGQQPQTASYTYGTLNTKPTGMSGASTNNTILVQSSFTAGSATLSSKPVVFSHLDAGNNPMLNFQGYYPDYQVGQPFQLDFDLIISSTSLKTNASIFSVFFRRNGTGTQVGLFTLDTTNYRAGLFSYDNINSSRSAYFNNVWNPNQLLHVTLLFNPRDDTMSLKINGSSVGSVTLAPCDDDQGVMTYYLGGSTNAGTGIFAVDNIVSSTFDYSAEDNSLPGGIIIDNNDIECCFHPASRDFDLFSIKNKTNDAIYAGWRNNLLGSMFRILFRNSSGTLVQIDNHSPHLGSNYNITTTDANKCLTINWTGFSVGSSNMVDVTVTATVPFAKPIVDWRINVVNRSTSYGVWEVRFPYLRFTPAGDAVNSYLAVPISVGQLMPNPFSDASQSNYMIIGVNSYPTCYNMQWGALYDSSLGGLYFGTHDPLGYRKDFVYGPANLQYLFYLAQQPENKGVAGTSYNSPYAFTTQIMGTSWYDATQIYREWAINHAPWTSKGTIAERTDIPQWYKDASLYFTAYGYSGTNQIASATLANNAITYANWYRNYYGLTNPIPLNWYNWQLYRPDQSSVKTDAEAGNNTGDDFPSVSDINSAVSTLKLNGIYVQGYLNSRIFDIPNLSDSTFPPGGWQQMAVKDVYGNYSVWSSSFPGYIEMCRSQSTYVNYITQTCLRLAQQSHMAGAYLDQFGEMHYDCFNSTHSHPKGCGYWQTQALRQMAATIHDTVKAFDPNSVFSGEDDSEVCMDNLDGNLFEWDLWPGSCPLQPAVYHDYWMNYGRSLDIAIGNTTRFNMTLGNLFVYGTKLGRFAVNSTSYLSNSNMPALGRAAKCRDAFKKYLSYGRMLAPLKFDTTIPDVSYTLPSSADWGSCVVTRPAIMSSAWESSDGNIGIVLFNVSSTNRSYQFTLSSDTYPIMNKPFALYQYNGSDGEPSLISVYSSSPQTISGTLSSAYAVMYEIVPMTCQDVWQLGLGLTQDLNQDCYINFNDLGMIADSWLNGKNFSDFAALAAVWLTCNDPANRTCTWNW